MLKIKDNVDLKELEKFGYKYKEDIKAYIKDNVKSKEINNNIPKWIQTKEYIILIFEKTREIKKGINIICPGSFKLVDILKTEYIDDLIKADMVEKVEA